MNDNVYTKCFIAGIILLFFGASVVLAINNNVETAKSNDEIVTSGFDDGLVGYWGFDEGDGNILIDESGNSNEGFIHGATRTDGISGQALDFDGVDDRVVLHDTFDETQGSLSFWVKTATEPTDEEAIFSQSCDSEEDGYRLLFSEWDGNFVLEKKTSSSAATIRMGELESDAWYHVVWVSDGDSYQGYIDGVEQELILESGTNDGDWFGDIDDSFHIRIGNIKYLYHENHVPFEGIIDEVRVYDYPLTSTEVKDLYDNPGGLSEKFIFGKFGNIRQPVGDLIVFDAVKIRCLGFSPFSFDKYSDSELIKISDDFQGLLLQNFIIGRCNTNS